MTCKNPHLLLFLLLEYRLNLGNLLLMSTKETKWGDVTWDQITRGCARPLVCTAPPQPPPPRFLLFLAFLLWWSKPPPCCKLRYGETHVAVIRGASGPQPTRNWIVPTTTWVSMEAESSRHAWLTPWGQPASLWGRESEDAAKPCLALSTHRNHGVVSILWATGLGMLRPSETHN